MRLLIVTFLLSISLFTTNAKANDAFCFIKYPTDPMCSPLMRAINIHLAQLGVGVNLRSLPVPLQRRLARFYPNLDLSRVRFGFSDRQPLNNATTSCYNIYFHHRQVINEISNMLFETPSNMQWLMHELKHSEQCIEMGMFEFRYRWMKAAEGYVWQNFGDLITGNLDWTQLHDSVPSENEAEVRASYAFGQMRGFYPTPIVGDSNGDGSTEVGTYQPSSGRWRSLRGGGDWSNVGRQGRIGDVGLMADVDGDGKDDFITYRPGVGQWTVRNVNGDTLYTSTYGRGEYVPFVGDFNGDGRADFAVYRASDARWWGITARGAELFRRLQVGTSRNTPLVGDFDGDGRADLGSYSKATGVWIFRRTDGTRIRGLNRWGRNAEFIPLIGNFRSTTRSEFALFNVNNSTFSARSRGATVFRNRTIREGTNSKIPFLADLLGNDSIDEPWVYIPNINIISDR